MMSDNEISYRAHSINRKILQTLYYMIYYFLVKYLKSLKNVESGASALVIYAPIGLLKATELYIGVSRGAIDA